MDANTGDLPERYVFDGRRLFFKGGVTHDVGSRLLVRAQVREGAHMARKLRNHQEGPSEKTPQRNLAQIQVNREKKRIKKGKVKRARISRRKVP